MAEAEVTKLKIADKKLAANKSTIELLEWLLENAKAGEIEQIMVVSWWGDTMRYDHGQITDITVKVGALTRLVFEICTDGA